MVRKLTLFLLFLSCAFPVMAAEDSEKFKGIYEKEWAFRMKEFPLFASYTGSHDYADQLGDVSEEAQTRRYEFWRGIRSELDGVSCHRLVREECINYRIFIKQMDNYLAAYETKSYLVPFNSDWGFYMELARLPAETDFGNLDDYRNYLGRLHQMPAIMDQYIALMRKGLELGITQPRVILDGRDEPIKAQIVESVDQSPFFGPFQEIPESVAGGEKAELLATAEKVISSDVIPAFQRLYDFFQQEYLPGARKSLGASELPGGDRYGHPRHGMDPGTGAELQTG